MAKSFDELKSLIDWLASNTLNRFEIYNIDKEKSITNCISYAEIVADFPTAVNYFEKLADNGIKTVQIVKKRKNGNSYKDRSCGLNFALSTNENVVAGASQALPAGTQQQSRSNSFSGLGNPGAGAFGGLGLPDIMEMKSQSDRYQELKESYTDIKRRFEDSEKKNRNLENENLRHQLGADTKPSALEKFLEGIASNPSAIPEIVGAFKGMGSTPALNAPQLQSHQLSPTKKTVVDLISSNPQVKDDHVAASYYVLVEALKGNEHFLKDYSELLTKHNLNGTNTNNNS